MKRIVFFGNGEVAARALEFLERCGESVVAVVLHPEARRRCGDRLLAAAERMGAVVIDGARLREESTLEQLRALRPELGVSVFFGYILKESLLALFGGGVINLHPSLLPYNRGAYPNVWSIVEGTPAGVTLHYIDPGVDTGDVIAQREVPVEPIDTSETLYARLERACLELFEEAWPRVADGSAPRLPQAAGQGTSHRVKDVERIDRIELDRDYKARELLDLLRARTFGLHPSAYFEVGGRKVYVRVSLEYADEPQETTHR